VNVTYSGLIFEIINQLASTLNFTYEVIEPKEGENFGILQPDGHWNGMMKLIVEKRVNQISNCMSVFPIFALWLDAELNLVNMEEF